MYARSLCGQGGDERELNDGQLVSMNLFAFKHDFLNYLDNGFKDFLEKNKNDLSSCEYFLPSVASGLIEKGIARIKLLSTDSKWFGMTYKGDLDIVKRKIVSMVENDISPSILW